MSAAVRDAIVSYLADRGAPLHVAAAIAGNFSVETGGFSPKVLSGEKRGDNGKAAYLGQWRDGRLENLNQFAASRGEKVPSIPTQLDFMALELTPGSRYADPIASRKRDDIFSAPTIEQATEAFARHYERAGTPHMDRRQEAAQAAYQGFFESRTVNAPTPVARADAMWDAVVAAAQPAPLAEPREGYVSPLGPLGDRVVSNFGPRNAPQTPQGRGSSNHRGIDLTAGHGRGQVGYPAQAVAAGVITHAGPRGGYGNMVSVRHDDGTVSRYAHLQDVNPNIAVGTRIGQGSPIGTVGSTGKSQAPHLHFEMMDAQGRHINPSNVIDFAQNRSVPTPSPRTSNVPTIAHSGAPARAAQEQSMAALNRSQETPLISMAAAPVQSAMIPSLDLFSAPRIDAAQPVVQANAYAPAFNAPSAAPQTAREAFNIDDRINQAHSVSVPELASVADARVAQAHSVPSAAPQLADNRVAQAHAVGAPSARSAQDTSMAALASYQAERAPAQAFAAAAQTPIAQTAPVHTASVPAYASTPALGPTPTARPDNLATQIVANAVQPTAPVQSPSVHNYAPMPDHISSAPRTGGIFGDGGIFSPANVQNTAVGGLGGFAGGALGGALLGPVGALVGSAVGRHMAVDKFGARAPDPIAPLGIAEFNRLMAQNYTPGLAFPDALNFDTIYHYSGDGPSYSDMAAISPGAADAISEGRGGLY